MKEVAKVVIIDKNDQYLLLWLNNHPRFHNDPDLPGGTVDKGEEPMAAALREVREEVGIQLLAADVELLYTGSSYSAHGTVYHLYRCRLSKRPTVALSWEHQAYRWVSDKEFLRLSAGATDTYIHMVHNVVSRLKLKS